MSHCEGFQNARAKALYLSAANKVLLKLLQYRLRSNPRNFLVDLTHLQYIFFQCDKFQNSSAKASRESDADKNVLYQYQPTKREIALALSQIGWMGAKNR